jgi:hypothetical protein
MKEGKASLKHAPRWQYDCGNCKFAWCCGPTCSCSLKHRLPDPPLKRQDEVDEALVQIGYAPQFHGKGAQRR